MNKRFLRSVMALGLAAVMLLGYGDVKVMAADPPDEIITDAVTDSETGSINGHTTGATLTTNNLKSVATTTFNVGGGSIAVKAEIYYWLGLVNYRSVSDENSGVAGSVSASVSKKYGGADVIGGRSYHRVSWYSYTWSPILTVGEIPGSYTGL